MTANNRPASAVETAQEAAQSAIAQGKAEAADLMDDAATTIKRTAAKARDMASTLGHDVQEKVADTAATLRDQAETKAADLRDSLTESGDRLAQSLRRAAEADRTPDIPARVLSTAADGVTYATDHLRGTTLNDMAAAIRSSAQRNPGLFAAGAALAGFALARFLMASRGAADRR